MVRIGAVVVMMVTANVACAQVAPAPSRLGDFNDIPCHEAKMHVTSDDQCGLWRGTQAGTPRYQAAHYMVHGQGAGAGSLEYKATMTYAYDPETWATVVHSSDVPAYMTGYDETTQDATSWSEMAKAGSDFFKPFSNGAKKCFAFHRRGPVKNSGTLYRMTGWFCDGAKANGFTADEARAVLAMIQTTN